MLRILFEEESDMCRRTKRAVFFVASVAILLLSVAGSARAKTSVTKHSGSLADGATYLIEVPANWNGTLFLYSHGYVVPGSPNPAQDVGDPFTRFFMLSSGYALAGSSYATTGWAIHEAAGLDLDADLKLLNETVRISADPEAVHYLERNIIFDGEIHIPVLTLHTKGDGLVVVQNESAYKKVVEEASNGEFLRRTFVDRAGHCAFTPAETIAAVQTLVNRLDTGKWNDVDASDLNNAAAALGPGFNIFGTSAGIVPVPPAFFKFNPSRYLRPFDALTEECEFGFLCGDPSFERGER
jgi:hypothetical protein